jgi:hypothetical protein
MYLRAQFEPHYSPPSQPLTTPSLSSFNVFAVFIVENRDLVFVQVLSVSICLIFNVLAAPFLHLHPLLRSVKVQKQKLNFSFV